MVHNNVHASALTGRKIPYLITCLPNDSGNLLLEDRQSFYRYNYVKYMGNVSYPVMGRRKTYFHVTALYNKNIRVMRCLANEPTLDVTGLLGQSDGKYTVIS